jgi:16S rRNA processing protein RimM
LRQYLEIGAVVSQHGVRGAVKLMPWADSPEVLRGLKYFYQTEEGGDPLEAEKVSVLGRMVMVKFRGFDTPEQARKLIGKTLYAFRGDLHIPQGRVLIDDMIGASVRDLSTGRVYGTLAWVGSNGPQDLYEVDTPSGKAYIPAVSEFIAGYSEEERTLYVTPIKGMFDDED